MKEQLMNIPPANAQGAVWAVRERREATQFLLFDWISRETTENPYPGSQDY
jgi:hypothetical protein